MTHGAQQAKGAAQDAAGNVRDNVQSAAEAGQEAVEKKSSGLLSGMGCGVVRGGGGCWVRL